MNPRFEFTYSLGETHGKVFANTTGEARSLIKKELRKAGMSDRLPKRNVCFIIHRKVREE